MGIFLKVLSKNRFSNFDEFRDDDQENSENESLNDDLDQSCNVDADEKIYTASQHASGPLGGKKPYKKANLTAGISHTKQESQQPQEVFFDEGEDQQNADNYYVQAEEIIAEPKFAT